MVIFLAGGADSFSMLVPHSNCKDKDLYDEYAKVRTGAAIAKTSLLPITPKAGTQPCDTFGLNPNLPFVKSLYDTNEAALLANIGAMIEPVSKEGYFKRSANLPPGLFAHNVMQRSMHNLHAQSPTAKGHVHTLMSLW